MRRFFNHCKTILNKQYNIFYFCIAVVPSQCILGKTLMKKQMLMSVATKVCLQINCKLGGELWAVEIPVSDAGSGVVSAHGLLCYLSFCKL